MLLFADDAFRFVFVFMRARRSHATLRLLDCALLLPCSAQERLSYGFRHFCLRALCAHDGAAQRYYAMPRRYFCARCAICALFERATRLMPAFDDA